MNAMLHHLKIQPVEFRISLKEISLIQTDTKE